MTDVNDKFESSVDYPVIRVDMDYCADPLWGSASRDGGFCNLCLEDFKSVLSKELMHSLLYYKRSWESLHSSQYIDMLEDYESPFLDGLHANLLKVQIEISKQLKREMPDKIVYFFCINEITGSRHNEIILRDGKAFITEVEE